MGSPKADPAADASPGWQHTHSYSSHQLQIKYEDCILAEPAHGQREWAVFGIFDGHNGDAVSQLLGDRMLAELSKRMPEQSMPQRFDTDSAFFYAEAVRRALAGAFVAIDLISKRDSRRYGGAGSTATVVVQCGRLLTVANVGNSRCAVDTGSSSVELSVDDKLGNCDEEVQRLQEAPGVLLAQLKADASGPAAPGEAGVGPLRVWPGGWHVSRAIGDADASPCVVPHPHINQVILPKRATRLVMATGTVWSSFDTHHKAVSCLRGVSLHNAAAALVQKAAGKWRAYNDRTVLVVDFVPEAMSSFKSQLRLDRLSRSSSNNSRPINVARFTPPMNFTRFTPPVAFNRFTPPLVIPDLGLLRWSPGSRNSNNNSINNSMNSNAAANSTLTLPPSPQPAAPTPAPQTPTTPQRKKQRTSVLSLFGAWACFMPRPLLQQKQQEAQQLLRLQHSRQSGAGSSSRRSNNGTGTLNTCSDAPSMHTQGEEARLTVLASVDAFKAYAKGRYDDLEDVLRSIDARRLGKPPPRSLSTGDLVTLSRAAEGGSVRFSWEGGSAMTSMSY